jgi:hypothetical protein
VALLAAVASTPAVSASTPDDPFAARFRQVSKRFPDVVARAYDNDIAQALAATAEQVAATVAAWWREQLHTVGREQRRSA